MGRLSDFATRVAAGLTVAVLTSVGLTVWAWLKDAGPASIVYGLVTLVCLLWLFDRFGWGPSTEEKIRRALDVSGFPFRKVREADAAFEFHFEITVDGGVVSISRRKDAGWIVIRTIIAFTAQQRVALNDVVAMELLRRGIGYVFDVPAGRIILQDEVPVTRAGEDLLARIFFVKTTTKLAITMVQAETTRVMTSLKQRAASETPPPRA